MRTGPLDMTGLDRKIAVGASVLMTFSVAVNMVAFQGKGTGAGQGSAIETGGLPSRGGWIDVMPASSLSLNIAGESPGHCNVSRARGR